MYDTQIRNCKDRGYSLPKYTKEEFKKWLLENSTFICLYQEWVNSNYQKELKPSIDRLNDYKTYSFDNIQIITWKENRIKAYKSMKEGGNNKNNKAVDWFTAEGIFIKRFHSINEAERQTGIKALVIHKHCEKLVTPRKYKPFWKYSLIPNDNSEQY